VLDGLLVVLVAALAFSLASTPARNSDLWLHLASGRLLAGGRLPAGTDPFASTTEGAFWVNPSWLADGALHALHVLGGDRSLVIAKALLVTGVAALFLCFRRRGTRVGAVVPAAVAAVLALGPWLLLQPAIFSVLGVTLTIYVLERPGLVVGRQPEYARALRWLLVPLFALWANLDGWFLLGPVLVALYAGGEGLRRLFGATPPDRTGEVRTLGLLTLAGLAACLLTPSHYHALAWPAPLGLSHTEQALRHDPLGQGLFVSPFGSPLRTATAFASPGGWAYCLLLVAGLFSFGQCGQSLHPGRLLAWLALAALSIYHARAIPFFAVAAGPMLALNLQDWARLQAASSVADQQTGRQALFRRLVLFLSPCLLASLLVLAWPGWLQPAPYRPRSWAVEPDESLVRLAALLDRWHAEGKLSGDRFDLVFSPEAAHHLAWFCPAEKGFLDARWPLFDRVADDFLAIRRALLRPEGPNPALGPLLDLYHIDRVAVHDPDFGRTTQAFGCLLKGGDEWELLAVEGGTALFGRRGGARQPFDVHRAAYRPGADQRAPPGPLRAPEPPGTFSAFSRGRDERSADRAEAALYVAYFDVLAERTGDVLARQWLAAHAAGLLIPGPAGPGAGTETALAVRLSLTPLQDTFDPQVARPAQPVAGQMASQFLAARDRGPAEALLLAIRAARRALTSNPDDARAFLMLGEAYLRLAGRTREQGWVAALPALGPIRRAQAVTALEQAARVRPDLDRAHALLAQLYFEENQLDRALEHLRTRLHLAERQDAAHVRDADAAVKRLRHDVETMESLVGRAEEVYAANSKESSEPSKVLERAERAARHGLSRKALEMLLASHPAIFGQAGTQLQLELMLNAGRAYEVQETLGGSAHFPALQVEAAAACGDYEAAEAALERLSEPLRLVGFSREQVLPVRQAVSLRVAGAVLGRPDPTAGLAGLAAAGYQRREWLQPLGGPAGPDLLRQEADVRVLRGLLAVESGAVEAAREHFAAALRVWGDDQRAAAGAGLDFLARPIAQDEMRFLEED
jgi:tetratricopeptide (TPR) repeat protein